MGMKAKRVSRSFAKVVVFRGKPTGGATTLKKEDLTKNKHGRIVSKKQSALAKKRAAGGWIAAVTKARKELGVKGFQAVKKGTPLYKKAKEHYGQCARRLRCVSPLSMLGAGRS